MDAVFDVLPPNIKEQLYRLSGNLLEEIQEIRLRINRPVEVSSRGIPHFLPYACSKEDAELFISKLANHSFYTLEEELKRGYITIEGGHRIGLGGKAILENGKVKGLRHLASFNIRIAREKIGSAEPLIPFLFDGNWKHTMIIGPPQSGKTTLLRDLARIVSAGCPEKGIQAMKAGIVDERSEIAGCVQGVPQLSFGPRIDVLDACPKAEGMMMMIRSLSPDVLIVDEIGREEDKQAILEAVNAGIALMMTTHGKSLEDIQKRPMLKEIVEQNVFERFLELSAEKNPGTICAIRSMDGRAVGIHV